MKRIDIDRFTLMVTPSAGLDIAGYLALVSNHLYDDLGPTFANIAIGVLRWARAIALDYVASIATHLWINAAPM